MRSELISEIFSVEEQAEKIVSDAQKKAHSLIIAAQQKGEQHLSEAVEKERAKRDTKIQKRQQESRDTIDKVKKEIELKESEDSELVSCAHDIALDVVKLLSTTKIGDRLL